MKPTPFMFRSMAWELASSCVSNNINHLQFWNWQTFGRLRFESNQAMQRKRDFSGPLIDVLWRQE
jgi:hypothetical protein